MNDIVPTEQALFAGLAIVFAYVLIRFAAALRGADHGRRMLAGGGVVFAVAPPAVVGLLPQSPGVSPDDLRVLLIGSAVWVVLALAFSAFAISRSRTTVQLRV